MSKNQERYTIKRTLKEAKEDAGKQLEDAIAFFIITVTPVTGTDDEVQIHYHRRMPVDKALFVLEQAIIDTKAEAARKAEQMPYNLPGSEIN